MKVYSVWHRFLEGNTIKRLIQGFVVGSICTIFTGFTFDGWQRGATVETSIASATRATLIKTLAPICADKYMQAAKSDDSMKEKFATVSSWKRDQFLQKAGWTTFPGGEEPDIDVAQACSELLKVSLELE